MSTSATIEFNDGEQKFAVYLHGDGYPSGVQEALNKALKLAWELPRFEADEFAAAFVAANKTGQGGVRLVKNHRQIGSIYHYVVTLKSDNLYVKAYKADHDGDRLFLAEGLLSWMSTWSE